MIAISPVTIFDLHLLTELEVQLFSSDIISHRQFKYLITKANSIVVKAESDEIFSGYMVLLKRRNSSGLRIYSLGVAEYARNQGVAQKFLSYAEQEAQRNHCNRLTLEVAVNNESAVRLYRKAGYIEYGQKENYYEDGCTALVFHKKIPLPEISR